MSASRAAQLSRTALLTLVPVGLLVEPVLAAGAAALYLFLARLQRCWPYRVPFWTIAVVAVAATAASSHRLESLVGAAGLILLGLAFWAFYCRFNPSDAPTLAIGAAVGLLAAATQTIYQVAVSGAAQAVAFSFHTNVAAALFLLGIGFIAASLPLMRRSWLRGISGIALLLGLVGLVHTGSRSGFLALAAGGLVFSGLTLLRRPWFLLGGAAGILVLLAASLGAQAALRGAASHNLLTNASFESGNFPWVISDLSSRVKKGWDGESAVRLNASGQRWDPMLEYRVGIDVQDGERYVLSLWARPAPAAVDQVFVRVEAVDARGAFLARAGREGWTEHGERYAGGRWLLPHAPAGVWKRVALPLAPAPAGTAAFRVKIARDVEGTGTYGLIDALQLELGEEATPWVAGRGPGLGIILSPPLSRLRGLHTPMAASGGRIPMWSFGLELAAARPVLGYGFGAESWLVEPQAPRFVPNPLAHLHSFYLRLLIEGGSALLVAILLWLGLVALRLLRRARAGNGAAAAALGTFVALLVQSAFDPILSHWYVALGFWLVMCVGLTTPTPAEQWMQRSEEPTGG